MKGTKGTIALAAALIALLLLPLKMYLRLRRIKERNHCYGAFMNPSMIWIRRIVSCTGGRDPW